jgi:hypothetical protein
LVADVKQWLKIPVTDTADDVLIGQCAGAAEPVVTRARPDAAADPTANPEAYQAGVMLAGKLVRRRNSPAGIESFGDSVTYVAAYDPELALLLRRGSNRLPAVG